MFGVNQRRTRRIGGRETMIWPFAKARFGRARKRSGKRFRKNQDGSAAIEFAMIAAPFLYLLMAIFETGFMLFSEYVIENGTAQAARMIRTGQIQTQSMSQNSFKTLVCGNLASFLDCNNKLYVDVRKWTAFADITSSDPIGSNGELSSQAKNGGFDPGGPMDVITVRVYYVWDLMTPGISMLNNLANGRRVLTAGAAFRNEPYE